MITARLDSGAPVQPSAQPSNSDTGLAGNAPLRSVFPTTSARSAKVQQTLTASLAHTTTHVYDSYVQRFAIFMDDNDIDIDSVDTEAIMLFLAEFTAKRGEYSHSYIRAMKSAILKAITN